MPLPAKSSWTPAAQAVNAPLSLFNPVHSKASEIIWVLARHLQAITSSLGCSPGRGWDSTGTEHPTGRALDWIISTRVGRKASSEGRAWIGDMIVDALIRNSDQIHIRHIIWNRRIWKRRYRNTPTAWTNLKGRSGVSDWHEDHIHVFLDDTRGTIPNFVISNVNVPTIPEDDDIMAGITKDELAALIQNNTRVAMLGVLETPRYSEYIDENGNMKNDPRTLSDILFSTHAHSVAANRTVALLAKESGMDTKEIVSALLAELAPIAHEVVDSEELANEIVKKFGEKLTS